MAFQKINLTSKGLTNILNYNQFLKKPDDPTLRVFQSPEGYFLNVTRIEQTPEEEKMSKEMEQFYNYYRSNIEEKKDD